MNISTVKYWNVWVSILFGCLTFVFWYFFYPQALSYQEQFQLFLWTGDYLANSLNVPGGFGAWLGELITQFYYVPWLGALLLSGLFVAFAWIVGWLPTMLLFWLLGDPAVFLGYVMAVMLSQAAFRLNKTEGKYGQLLDIIIIPFLYWLAGPISLLYVLLRITKLGAWGCLNIIYLLAIVLLSYRYVLDQQPLEMVMTPTRYYNISLKTNKLMWVIPLVALGEYIISHHKVIVKHKRKTLTMTYCAACLLVAWLGISNCYDKDQYELIRQDYLVRNERWDEIIEHAEKYQVQVPFSSVCVNLALAQTRQLGDRMFDFYQNGEDALIMPYIKENTPAMLPTSEALWHLGMVNAAQRYMFDVQEGLLNGHLSGRCTKRIVECMLVNGHYKAAKKHIQRLKESLFYRTWAKETEKMLNNEKCINTHPIYGKIRAERFRQNQLFNYLEIDKMFGSLFMENTNNKMALDYYMGQLLLDSKIGPFKRSMPLVERYGGYNQMPRGYADALNAIASGGRMMGSPYVNYVNRMLQTRVRRVSTPNYDEK